MKKKSCMLLAKVIFLNNTKRVTTLFHERARSHVLYQSEIWFAMSSNTESLCIWLPKE